MINLTLHINKLDEEQTIPKRKEINIIAEISTTANRNRIEKNQHNQVLVIQKDQQI